MTENESMSGRKTLAADIKRIAFGYLLLHIDINLMTLNILPDWLGYILIIKSLAALNEEDGTAMLLQPLGILLTVWELVKWGAALLGAEFNGYIIDLVAAAAALYFHFQLLTNIANAVEKYDCPNKQILTLRTVRTVLITVMAAPFAWERYTAVTIVMVIINLFVALWICKVLFSLRGTLEAAADEQ